MEFLEDVVMENKLLRRDTREKKDVLKNISSSINQMSETNTDIRDASTGPRWLTPHQSKIMYYLIHT